MTFNELRGRAAVMHAVLLGACGRHGHRGLRRGVTEPIVVATPMAPGKVALLRAALLECRTSDPLIEIRRRR